MIAIGIGIFLVIQAAVLFFVLALCKSAALGDREYERAFVAEQKGASQKAERVDFIRERHVPVEVKAASRPVIRSQVSNR